MIRNIIKVFLSTVVFSILLTFETQIVYAQFIDSWILTSPLNYSISNHAAVVQDGKIFVINGSSLTGATHPDTLESVILSDGSIQNWLTTTTLLSPPLIGLEGTTINNYSYVAGGLIDLVNGIYTTVSTVSISQYSNGLFGSWTTSDKPLPSDRSQGGLVAINNKLYYLGGYQAYSLNGTEYPKTEVYMSTVNIDGTLNDWNSTTPLYPSQPKYNIAAVETGKKILTIAGKYDQNNRFSRDVWQADVNPDGTLGSWSQTYSLPDNNGQYSGYNSVGAVRVENYIIVAGGNVPGAHSNKVYYTTINPDGSINDWQTSQNNLPIHVGGGALQYANGYLYYIGGWTDEKGSYDNKVIFAKLGITTNNDLDVPNFKQYTAPWGPITYDHTQNWSSDPTISRWGCALTSSAMILSYFGYDEATPGTLNNYLIYNNGYTPNGLVRWPAIGAYTKKYNTGQKHLEFSYVGSSQQNINDLLEAEIPPIIKLSKNGNTHFLVAKGKFGDSDFNINDPDSSTNLHLTQATTQWGNIANIGKFTPTQTDISYLEFYIDNNFDLKVYDTDGNEITEGYTTEEPVVDSNGSSLNNIVLKALYIPKPISGEYKVEVYGNGDYTLSIYATDTKGDTFKSELSGSDKDIIYTTINKDDSSQTTNITLGFESIIKIWKDAYANNLIPVRGLYTAELSLLKDSQKLSLRERSRASEVLLKLSKAVVERTRPWMIDEEFKSDFLQYLTEFINSD